ncbi:hypothetical protein RHMOL_Rhmol02G0153400 [Rhododendron molle]|uniref:Uncharacterized protein n=1 Tax=Rhododendron molle TaxID=49168 RepID=A0ACC0PRS1_RHOML|nr:hypothetical protein RHMOL_Rhmol02G0153400 [Rhododendron molle]
MNLSFFCYLDLDIVSLLDLATVPRHPHLRLNYFVCWMQRYDSHTWNLSMIQLLLQALVIQPQLKITRLETSNPYLQFFVKFATIHYNEL